MYLIDPVPQYRVIVSNLPRCMFANFDRACSNNSGIKAEIACSWLGSSRFPASFSPSVVFSRHARRPGNSPTILIVLAKSNVSSVMNIACSLSESTLTGISDLSGEGGDETSRSSSSARNTLEEKPGVAASSGTGVSSYPASGQVRVASARPGQAVLHPPLSVC